MKQKRKFFFFLIAGLLFLSACNPDCEYQNFVSASVEPAYRLPGEDVLVKTIPPDFLRNVTSLYLEKRLNNKVTFMEIKAEYNAEAEGLIASLDETIVDVGNQNIYIRDEDCGGYIPLNTVNVIDEGFRATNPGLFVTPTPPIVIIPSLPIPSPTNVINTWFSPDDPAYCIWFFPELDTLRENGQITCIREMTRLRPGDIPNKTGTRELRCGGTDEDYDHNNPVTGFIDQSTGQVNITIDRSSKGFGTEQYLGQIVEPATLPEDYQTGGRCSADDKEKPPTIMVLTSQKTGRKLVMYRHVPSNFDGSLLCPPR